MDPDKTTEELLADLDAAWQQARERIARGECPSYEVEYLVQVMRASARGRLKPEVTYAAHLSYTEHYRQDLRNARKRAVKASKKRDRKTLPPRSRESFGERFRKAGPLLDLRVARARELVSEELGEATPLRLLLTWVDQLEFCVRTSNRLWDVSIEYVWQLAEKSKEELLKLPHFGPGTVNEILELISDWFGDRRLLDGEGMSLDPQLRQALEIACAEHP